MLDAVASLVRRHDPDRFLTSLFAPADLRGALLTLYAFNHELARAREVVSEPPLALIRLQWWREVVEGARRRHEVAEPLTAAVEAGALRRSDLLALVEAREIEVDPMIPTVTAWRGYILASAGGLAVAAARLLGADDPEMFRPLGAAYGVTGVLRSIPVLARQARCLLPADLLASHGLSPEAAIAAPNGEPMRPVIDSLRDQARDFLDENRRARIPRAAIAAALPAVLARRDLARRGETPLERGLGDRLAVTLAGFTGRIG